MNVGVIGAGAWGTAFSIQLAGKGHHVLMWAYEPELPDLVEKTGENQLFLAGITLPQGIDVTNNLQKVIDFSEEIIIATPSFALRPTLEGVAGGLSNKKILILTKGLEKPTFLTVSQVASSVLGDAARVAVLSGPSFAVEVAKKMFTSVVVASADKKLSLFFQDMCHDERFRVYTTGDVTGVELGGALKNVMAIGAGIIEGLGLGHNTLAAYITRALAEIKRLGARLGARETTFMGLSGMGDLILTCNGPLSRNRAFGVELAGGKSAREIIQSKRVVVEGFHTIDAAYSLSQKLGVEMPITEELYRVVHENKDIKASFDDICRRAIREEEDA